MEYKEDRDKLVEMIFVGLQCFGFLFFVFVVFVIYLNYDILMYRIMMIFFLLNYFSKVWFIVNQG